MRSEPATPTSDLSRRPERTGIVRTPEPYVLVQQSALGRANSPLRSVKELDRAGQVIGANTDDSVGVWLKYD